MGRATRNMIRSIRDEWKKIGDGEREIHFPGIVEIYS